ncbi:MAG: DUF975 family protein [bacterium]
MQWFYAVNGQQQGPVEWGALVALATEGKLTPSDLVWNSTMGNQWVKASTITGLFGLSQSVSPNPPPPASEWSSSAKFASNTHNRDLMGEARNVLEGQWGLAIGASLIYTVVAIVMGIIPYLGSILSFVLSGPLMLGLYLFFLTLSRRQQAGIGMIFDGFKQFGTAFLASLLMGLLIFAWMLPALAVGITAAVMAVVNFKTAGAGGSWASAMGMFLLFIPLFLAALVPVIMAQYRYSMTYFVINEMPGIGSLEAIRHSCQMMNGNKWKFFCLQWRFFGWALLCILTLGIGFIWLWPYMMTSMACFYNDLRKGQTNG